MFCVTDTSCSALGVVLVVFVPVDVFSLPPDDVPTPPPEELPVPPDDALTVMDAACTSGSTLPPRSSLISIFLIRRVADPEPFPFILSVPRMIPVASDLT